MIDEAINVYEKSIIYRLPLKHPYERLAILYRKRKDYENEIRVIKIAIEVFMKENERRANMVIDEDNSMYNQVMQALETNESIKYEDGKWAFVQYDVMSYITRLEKAQTLLDKSKTKRNEKSIDFVDGIVLFLHISCTRSSKICNGKPKFKRFS